MRTSAPEIPYVTTLYCFCCEERRTFMHFGEMVPLDQDTPWPDVSFCPNCGESFNNDLSVHIAEVADIDQVCRAVSEKRYNPIQREVDS